MTTRAIAWVFAAALLPAAMAAPDDDKAIERGEYLVHAGGCITCHTAEGEDAIPLAGGRALESPYGTF